MKRQSVVVEAPEDGLTLQRLLHARLGASNALVRGWIAHGLVRKNRQRATSPAERVKVGDRLDVEHDPGTRYSAPPASRPGYGYRILHEEDCLVAVDKDAGILSVPAAIPDGTSVEEALQAAYRKRGFRRPFVSAVHRIDRFTSGIVVFARTPVTHAQLRAQFAANRPERIYLAVAQGSVETTTGRLVHHLVEHPKSLKVQVVAPGGEGRIASCSYRVRSRFPHATLLEVRLETGRRNQIRVQLAAQGHPLVGDVAYGQASPLIGRVALHAHRLRIEHPVRGGPVEIVAPPPADFARLLRALKRGDNPSGTPIRVKPRADSIPKRGR